MVELIITEKPSTAKKIAESLADDKLEKSTFNKKVPYYELHHGKNKIIVACAVGHLYNLAEKDKHGWTYPSFDVEWKPSYEGKKGSDYTKNYLNAIISLAKKADKFAVATDYDIEGEVIGYNIIRFACGQKDARRMKFSTTTKEDLRNSYANISPHLDWLQAEAGLTRHQLDWWWGINLSRALTLSIKNATKSFKIMSIGRVQGPALKILAEREKEIKSFVPVPFWQIELNTDKLDAWHVEDKFWDKAH
ncbi:MAG: DNA topoisomerase, partial [Nanoarchaeota archaeon]